VNVCLNYICVHLCGCLCLSECLFELHFCECLCLSECLSKQLSRCLYINERFLQHLSRCLCLSEHLFKHLFEQLYLSEWFHWNSKFKTLISQVMSEEQHYNIQMLALFMINEKFLKSLFHVAKFMNFVTIQFQFWNLVY